MGSDGMLSFCIRWLTVILGLAWLLRPTGAIAASAIDLRAVEGVQEMVVATADLAASERSYRAALGYERRHGGRVDPKLAEFWQSPAASAPLALGRERLLGNPSNDQGLLRLVEIPPTPSQVQIRSSARPFDTGGIFNFNVLVHDIDRVFADLRREGFVGFADPNRYQLLGRRYAGALLSGRDGVTINLLQRVDQGYPDLPPFKRASHIINATQMVRDFARAQRFFREQLGWVQRWEAAPTWPADGSNNMGLPPSLVQSGQIGERAASFAVSADARGGTIEIFAFTGLTGRDFARRAHAPNTGLLAYRVHVRDLALLERGLRQRGVEIAARADALILAPYGTVAALRVVAPDGAWIEFCSQRQR